MKRILLIIIALSTLLLAGCTQDEPGWGNVQLVNESGYAYGVPAVDGKPRVSNMPYVYDIAEGNVPDHRVFYKLGYNGSVDTSEEDIWSAGGTYVFPAAAQQMELVSSSAEDDPDKGAGVPGTGVWTVVVTYLDNLYVEHTETVTLNGTGVVTTAANDIYRVNAIRANTVGTSLRAVGTISIRNLADTPIYRQILPLMTRGREGIYTVPFGKELYITSATISSGYSTVGRNVKWTFRATYNDISATVLTFFMPFFEVQTQDSTVVQEFILPYKFPATVDIKISAISDANNSVCTVYLEGWQENE